MKKKLMASALAAAIALSASVSVSAAWVKDAGQNWRWTENGVAQTGWKWINGAWYHFGADGVMSTGWKWIDDNWYYLQPSGVMHKGWIKTGGIWYYLSADGSMAASKWLKHTDGKWYYLAENGAMATGFFTVGGKTYFADGLGAMQDGVLEINSDLYYFDESGAMQTGKVEIDGVLYRFDEDGKAFGWRRPAPEAAFSVSEDGAILPAVPTEPEVPAGGGYVPSEPDTPSKDEHIDAAAVSNLSITSWYGADNAYLDTSVGIDFDTIKITDITSVRFDLYRDDKKMGSAVSQGANLETLFADCAQYWEAEDWRTVTGVRTLSNAFKNRDAEEDNGYWVRSACTASAYSEEQPNKLVVTVETADDRYISTQNGFSVTALPKEEHINAAEVSAPSITGWYGDNFEYLDTSVGIDFDTIKITDITSVRFDLYRDGEEMGSAVSQGANLETLFADCAQYWEAEDWRTVTGVRTLSNAFKNREAEEDNGYWVRSACTASAYSEEQPNKLVVTVETAQDRYTTTGTGFVVIPASTEAE